MELGEEVLVGIVMVILANGMKRFLITKEESVGHSVQYLSKQEGSQRFSLAKEAKPPSVG